MSQSVTTPQEPTQGKDETAKPQRPPLARVLIPLGAIAIAASIGVWYFLSRPQTNALTLSGRIEGYPTDVGAKVGGRVNSVAVREGDRVTKGNTIVQLDDDEIQAQLRGAKARVAAARQGEQQARLQIAVVENQIQEAQLSLEQARGSTQGQVNQAEANVATTQAQLAQAEAQVKQAQAELKLAAQNRDRYAQLWKAGAGTRQQYDQAQSAYDTARATVESREAAVVAARRQVSAAEGGLAQARTTSFNPDIRNAQLSALKQQLNVARSQLAAAQDEVQNAMAAQQQIQAQLAYLNIPSPIDGVVLTRSVEPGQVVAMGKTLLTVINPNQVYLRGYIPGGEIGKVKIGQSARVFLDSAPDRPIPAQVAAVDTQASFTPENIYFREDRVRQVFG
ncbi:MAG: HlyD family efflux transporter periplasmic adaptor subunit, partial [Leptolyngbyaceae bacterium]|nr:HlyD family efflux transporter periplasmic adaptor subunit [Leptolyngbyaceae bacterium]